MTANVSFNLIAIVSLLVKLKSFPTGKECAHYRSPRQKKKKNMYIFTWTVRKALRAVLVLRTRIEKCTAC